MRIQKIVIVFLVLSCTAIVFLTLSNATKIRKNVFPDLSLPSGWARIKFDDFVQVDIPPTMRVQPNTEKDYMDSIYRVAHYAPPVFVFQEREIFNDSLISLNRYARVLFQKTNYSVTNFFKLRDDNFRLTTTAQMKNCGIMLLEWYPAERLKISGMPTFRIKYIRRYNLNPQILVDTYFLLFGHSVYSLTFAYDIEYASYWLSDFDKILKSVRIKKDEIDVLLTDTAGYSPSFYIYSADVLEEMMWHRRKISPQEEIEQLTEKSNVLYPMDIDEYTRLDSMRALPDMMIANYYTLWIDKSDFILPDSEYCNWKSKLIKHIKGLRRYGYFKKNKVTFIHCYSDKKGEKLFEIRTNSDEY